MRVRVVAVAWLTLVSVVVAVGASPAPAGAAPTVIDRSGWSIVAGQTTPNDGNGPQNAIDGNTGSIWHTRWQSPVPAFPHDLVVNLGASHDVEGFTYLPRQVGQNGEIKNYELYLSTDGVNWGSPVAAGQFPNDPGRSLQQVLFTSTTASWARLRSTSSWNGAFTSVAEFNLLGEGGGGGTSPPDLTVTGFRGTTIAWGPGLGSACSIIPGSGSPAGAEARATVASDCASGSFNAVGLTSGLYQFDFDRDGTVLTASITVRNPVAMWDTAWSLPNKSTPAQVDDYLDYLQAERFAGTWISIAPFNWQGGMNATNYAGHSLGSFTNPNPNYLDHVGYIIDEAAAHGLDVGVVVAWGTDYTGVHPGTWPNSSTFGPATDRFESCHPNPYSRISSTRAAALPGGYFTSCDPNDPSDWRNQKAYNYGFTLGDRWGDKPNVLWVMGGDYWDATSEDLTEHTWIKIVDGLRAAGATQDVTYQPGGYSSSWNNFAGDPWVDQVSFNHHCLQAAQLEVELAALAVYGKPVIASEVRYEDEWADANGLTWWCQSGSPGGNTIGLTEIVADAQAVLDSGTDHYVYGHDEGWSWDTNDEDGDGIIDALDRLGRPGEQAALELLGANVPDPPPVQFNLVAELTGLTFPTTIEFAPDGRIFVAEKAGVLKAFDGFNDPTPTTVFDISSAVNDSLDRGLLGLAVHPDFPGTPYLYTLYTSTERLPGTTGGDTVSNKLSRWEIALDNTVVGTEHVLIHDWCQTSNTHSAGDLEFGLDGYLYASAGEAGDPGYSDWGQSNNGCADPTNQGGALRSQDVLTSVGGEGADPVNLDGSIIRIDPLTGAAAPGNPLAGGTITGDDPIIAHGLRNPYRMAVRPGGGELYIGDVGSSAWEEINVVADPADGVVENFRWPCWEGPVVNGGFVGNPLCDDLVAGTGTWEVTTTLTPAFFEYAHPTSLLSCNAAGSSVTALAFEEDSNYGAAYDGALFFADYTRQCLFAMKAGPGGLPDPAQLEVLLQGEAVVDLESGPGGDLFLVDLLAGRVSRLDYQGVNGIPAAHLTASVIAGTAPLEVTFDGTGSSDPDDDPLTYQWDWNGDLVFDAVGATPTHTFTAAGTHLVTLRVTDPFGASHDASLTIDAGNTLPVPTIVEPLGDLTWAVGDYIPFVGSALDGEDGPIDPSDLDWTVRLHHCPDGVCHIHVETTIDGVASGGYLAADHAYPSWLEFELTATDSTGASASTSVLVYPRTSTVILETSPPGLDLVGGITPTQQTAPIVLEAIENGQLTVNAVGPQLHNGVEWDFGAWTDGGAQNHLITVPVDDLTLTAQYGVSTGYSIMPIGDSVTEGRDPNPGNPGDGWPTYRCYLWDDLAPYSVDFVGELTGTSGGTVGAHNLPADGCPWSFDEDHQSFWGERTDEVRPKAAAQAVLDPPDIALTHLGTNDVLGGQPNNVTVDTDHLGLITDLRAANPDIVTLLAQPIPCDPAAGNPAFGTKCSVEIPDLADRLYDLAWQTNTAQSPVIVIDQHTNLTLADLRDGVHPTSGGDDKMADAWFTGLEPVLTGIDPAGDVAVTGVAGTQVTWFPSSALVSGRPLSCAVVPGSGSGADRASLTSCTDGTFDAAGLTPGDYTFVYAATDTGATGNGSATHFGEVTITLTTNGTQVEVFPGDDIQAIVDANPPGTEFLLRAGTHRMQTVSPKDNQKFTGEPGTILNGSRVLTGWIQDGARWYVTGQTQQGAKRGFCAPEFPTYRCTEPEQLFIDDDVQVHVNSLGLVGPGTWYFDYGADRIYIGENPAGKLIETAVTPRAIFGSADGVLVRDLVVEKYANPAQEGAIDSRTGPGGAAGANWTIDGVEARLNHGSGVQVTSGSVIRNSYLHHNGQQGFSANGTGIVVEDTEIAFNNTARFSLDWEGGGNKLVGTDVTLRRLHTHDNYGPGIWVDIDSFNLLIEDNVVEDNFRAGIFFEVSETAVIRGNYAEGNGLDDPRAQAWLWASGILVASSGDAEVYDNVVVNNGNGITATQQNRGAGRLVEDLYVHDNVVTMAPDTTPPNTQSRSGVVQDIGDTAIFTSRNNVYQNNTYYGSGDRFSWFNSNRTFSQWQGFGLDTTGTLSAITSVPPTWSSSLTATGSTDTTISLTWSGASDPDGIGAYRIYEDTLGLVATTAGATSTTVRFLQPATTYGFTVQAVDVMGNESLTGPTTTASTAGGLQAPVVSVDVPVDGAVFVVGESVGFVASVTDDEAGLVDDIVWSSVPVGVSGSGGSIVVDGLGVGEYVVSASVTDSDGLSGSDSITVEVVEAPVPGSPVAGVVSGVTESWQRVDLAESFVDPVVVAGPASRNGGDPGVVEVRNVGSSSFEVRFREWDYLDVIHPAPEDVSYVVVERGVSVLPSGAVIEAGTASVSGSAGGVLLTGGFSTAPIVVSTVVADTEPLPVVVARLSGVSGGGFTARVQEQESSTATAAVTPVNWVAWSVGSDSGVVDGFGWETRQVSATDVFSGVSFGGSYGEVCVVGDMNTFNGPDPASVRYRNRTPAGIEVQVDEETSLDTETIHTTETIGLIITTCP